MNSPVYIHYGSSDFDPEYGFPVRSEKLWNKPIGGFWASRVDASFGWKDWCKQEDFHKENESESFKFCLKDDSRIHRIYGPKDLFELPMRDEGFSVLGPLIDFEKCVRDGIDALELCWYGDEFADKRSGNMYMELYGWDCDSIVVLNPNAVVPLEEGVQNGR